MSLDVEAGLFSFDLYKSSNSLKAIETVTTVIHGLLDGSVRAFQLSLSPSLNNGLCRLNLMTIYSMQLKAALFIK